MAAIAPLEQLNIAYAEIQSMRESNSEFYLKWITMLYRCEDFKIPYGYLCQLVMNVDISERYINRLKTRRHKDELIQLTQQLKKDFHPEYQHLSNFLKKNNRVGYKNICKMTLGITPEELKKE